jgi:phosphoribosylformimino-5-aminoimidazole carboxamide ribotide isomerase
MKTPTNSFQLIPAIDLIGGKAVRLSQGDFSKETIYSENPVALAQRFEDSGIKRLHLVDLDGARLGKISNLKVLADISRATNLIIDFGGGVKTEHDVDAVLNAGATYVAVGSVAVKQPELFAGWLLKFPNETFLPGADVRNGMLAVSGWVEQTKLPIQDFLNTLLKQGIKRYFCTDISKDGLLQGPAIELYKTLIAEFPDLELIASGGVSDFSDLVKLKEVGCSGVIIGKALYENKISLDQLKSFG